MTEFEWRVTAPLLPKEPGGVPRVDDRRVLDGIFWVLRSGSPWFDLCNRPCMGWSVVGTGPGRNPT